MMTNQNYDCQLCKNLRSTCYECEVLDSWLKLSTRDQKAVFNLWKHYEQGTADLENTQYKENLIYCTKKSIGPESFPIEAWRKKRVNFQDLF